MSDVKRVKVVRDWTVVALAVTALGSLGISAWQGWNTRIHARLSVQPRLTSSPLTSHYSSGTFATLENVGPGPAIISWAQVRVDDEESLGWESFKRSAVAAGLPEPVTQHFTSTDSIHPEATLRLVGYPDVLDECSRHLFREILKKSEYRVCFCSLYEKDCWTLRARLWGTRMVEESCAVSPEKSFATTAALPRSPASAPPPGCAPASTADTSEAVQSEE